MNWKTLTDVSNDMSCEQCGVTHQPSYFEMDGILRCADCNDRARGVLTVSERRAILNKYLGSMSSNDFESPDELDEYFSIENIKSMFPGEAINESEIEMAHDQAKLECFGWDD